MGGYPVTSIGYKAFKNHSQIESVSIPDSVTKIGMEAFMDCTNIRSITFGKNVANIESLAFSGCSSLSDFYITSVEAWLNVEINDNSANPMHYALTSSSFIQSLF